MMQRRSIVSFRELGGGIALAAAAFAMRHFRIHALASLLSLSAVASTGCAVDPAGGDLSEAPPGDAEDTGQVSSALPIQDDDGVTTTPVLDRCLLESTGSLSASPSSVSLGASTTLRWSYSIASRCSQVKVYVDSQTVTSNGSRVVTPQANEVHRLRFTISGYGERTVATTTIGVQLPPVVQITSNSQVPTFVQAVQTPNTQVVVANNVQLDLSNRQDIYVASGVRVQGGRAGLQAGPRLFTTTRPAALFRIPSGATNVRFTGVRIEGPDMGAADRNGASAIEIDSATNIEIDRCELSGWAGSAVGVRDTDGTASSPSPNATTIPVHTVNIHDNFIHHNQAVGGDGYGVVSGTGAHPLIQRNVFDWNRHAIAGDGKPGTGYTATHNLVLENGGLHRWIPFPGFWTHTHQFDMHGRNDCGVGDIFSDSLYNCGPAGHTTIIRNNAFFYTEDDDIKLRGTPVVGMFVGNNVFTHGSWSDATSQEESGLVNEGGNEFGYNGKNQLGTCDFDGDGINDSFMATGQSWWYRSGTTGPWEFLNASTKKLSQVSIGFFDGDNRCDVKADGVVFPGGRPAPFWTGTIGNLGTIGTVGFSAQR